MASICPIINFIAWLLFANLLMVSSLATAQSSASNDLAKTIKASKWQKRILVVYAPTDQDATYKQQKELLGKETAELDDRDMLIIDALEDQLSQPDKAYLQSELGVSSGAFAAVLIGKDGGVKLKQTRPITTKALFAIIDGMYMRKQEMKEKRGTQK